MFPDMRLKQQGSIYSRNNSTMSPASSAGNFTHPRLMISVFLLSERWRCQYSSVDVAAAIMRQVEGPYDL